MTVDHQPTMTRTLSADGTEIGYWTSGEGPPLLLVHGGLGDHTRWDALRPHLAPHVTVHAMDRRGRGASGDGREYAIEREYEDVAAVIDSVAGAPGSPVDVYCSSYGGLCALGAVPLTANVGRLLLYEAWPPVNPEAFTDPPGLAERMERMLAEGDREGVIVTAYRELLGMTEEQIEAVRAQPSWSARVAAAHTVPRELRAFARMRFDPRQGARINVPTLLLVGSETPEAQTGIETVAAALPDARVAVLEGQGHVADLLAPEVVADVVLGFLHEG
jgi:pimeloyl-ACP methyl ester carboxylesterase